MTELEALKVVLKRAEQVQDADPTAEEALQVVHRLVKTVEKAEADPYATRMLAEDVLRQIGNVPVAYARDLGVRSYLNENGFMALARNLSNEEIAWELDSQLGKIAEPEGIEKWLDAVELAAARALVMEAGLDWPGSSGEHGST